MVSGIGIDIVDMTQVERLNDKFAMKVLTQRELAAYHATIPEKRRREFIGSRFAAKEAFVKAIGTGFRGIGFQDIEVCKTEQGQPYIVCTVVQGVFHLSVSHSNQSIVAVVVWEQR